jgi:hypothetical protein
VEANGQRRRVSMTCVEPGEECFVAGQWWHESHPMVEQEKERLAKWMRSGGGQTAVPA